MTQVLDKFLHSDGVVYAYIINGDGDFAVISQADLDDIIFAEQFPENIDECTCTPDIDAACPSCVEFIRRKFGDTIPY